MRAFLWAFVCFFSLMTPRVGLAKEELQHAVDVTFCLYSSAEAFNLSMLAIHLERANISYQWLAFGTAHAILQKRHIPGMIKLPKNLKTLGTRGCWDEEAGLKKDQNAAIVSLVKNSKLLVIGTGSKLQLEIIKSLQARNFPILGYSDNFETLSTHRFLKMSLPYLKGLLVLTHTQADEIKKANPNLPVYAVGRDEIDMLIKKKGLDAEKQQIIKELKATCTFDPSKKTILYCSGYGPNAEAGFRHFVETMKDVRAKNYNILVNIHPASHARGEFEKSFQREHPHLQIPPKTLYSLKLVEVSDFVVSFGSSVIVCSLARDKPSCYLTPPSSNYSVMPMELGWAPTLKIPNDFWTWVVEGEKRGFNLRKELPGNSSFRIKEIISIYLNKIGRRSLK